MSSSLENLFKQIIDSENIAQKRKTAINKLKTEHTQIVEKIGEAQEQQQYHKRQVAVKTHQLNEIQLQVQYLTSKRDILNEQKKEQEEFLRQLRDKLKHLADERTKDREEFCFQVKSFSSQYDLDGQGQRQRDDEAKDELDKLLKQEEQLLKDIEELKKHREGIEKLKAERDGKQQELEAKQLILKQKKEELEKEQDETQQLQCEEQRVSSIPQSDPEFKKLQEELEECKNDPAKDLCLALQKEFKELQQAKWQRELKRKRDVQQSQRLAYKLAKQREKALSTAATTTTVSTASIAATFSAASSAVPAASSSAAVSATTLAAAGSQSQEGADSSEGVNPATSGNFRKFSNFALDTVSKQTKGPERESSLRIRGNRGGSQSNSQDSSQH